MKELYQRVTVSLLISTSLSLLTACSADYSLRCDGPLNELHQAINDKNEEKALAIVSSKTFSDINATCDHQKTPVLVRAAELGFKDLFKMLLNKGADKEKKDEQYDEQTPLIAAAERGYFKIVELLLSREFVGEIANIDAEDLDGMTALMHAAKRGHAKIIKLLLHKGANIDVKDWHGNTALMHLLMNGNKNRNTISSLRLLVNAKQNFTLTNSEGKNALRIAKDKLKSANTTSDKKFLQLAITLLKAKIPSDR